MYGKIKGLSFQLVFNISTRLSDFGYKGHVETCLISLSAKATSVGVPCFKFYRMG